MSPTPATDEMPTGTLAQYAADMRTAQYSPVTIRDRIELLVRLARHIHPTALLDATEDELRGFQSTYAHLSPNSANVYTRHVRALYTWAYKRRLILRNTAEDLDVPRVPRGMPHPTSFDDLRTIFACTTGQLRMAYVLAAFEGMRRGEICRLHVRDVELEGVPTLLVNGKGGHQRRIPLLAPVLAELQQHAVRRGWVLNIDGKPYPVEKLSIDSHTHLRGLGLRTTLHSMRGTFATNAGRLTKDPMLIRDLLGHQSVATTQIYMETDMNNAHARLASFSQLAGETLESSRPALRVVGG